LVSSIRCIKRQQLLSEVCDAARVKGIALFSFIDALLATIRMSLVEPKLSRAPGWQLNDRSPMQCGQLIRVTLGPKRVEAV